ncbi:MAG: putative transposase of IS4/5 family (DUF4096) [Rhodobacteraceae bacterium HLUCCA12]|nr:MAG: putative transposase of IS4/5 family (DUF4096) [Rhodobacteraceae bacterium HLUCCA12]
MSDLVWSTDARIARLEPCFPKSHGKRSIDDRRVPSGFIFISHNGLRWRDALAEYFPRKTLYNRWKQLSDTSIVWRNWDTTSAPCGAGITIRAGKRNGPVYGHAGWIAASVFRQRHCADHDLTGAFQVSTDLDILNDPRDLVLARETDPAKLAIEAA